MHRSSERFAHQYRFGPPPPFREASTYPRIDRPASGIPPMTCGERTASLGPCGLADNRFRCGSVHNALNLAIDQNSMGRYSKRTIRRCFTLTSFVAFTPYQAVTIWFQALCTSRQGYFSTFTQATSALSVSRSI
jgi:hypothetical protein